MGLTAKNPFDNDALEGTDAEDPDDLPIDEVGSTDEDSITLDEIHHIGLAVADIDDALDEYRSLFGAVVIERGELFDEDASAALVDLGSSRLLMLAALSDESWIAELLDGMRSGFSHVGYRVDDLTATMARLEHAGWELIDDEPREGLAGLRTCYVHPPEQPGTLILIVEQT